MQSAADLAERFGVSAHHLAKVLRTLATAGLVRAERGAAGGYRFVANRRRTTLMDIVALFEPAPGQRAPEPGEDTDIGRTLQRVLMEIDEIAEATLRSISLETMLRTTRKW
jgi:Rrf2 family protein